MAVENRKTEAYGTRSSKILYHRPLLLLVLANFVLLNKGTIAKNVDICQDVDHAAYFSHACCKGKLVKYGIDFQEHWKTCATQNLQKKETVYDTMWRVYSCIIRRSFPQKPTLAKFTSQMTKNFEQSWKKEIKEMVAAEVTQGADEDDKDYFNRIRLAYYKAEKQFCTGVKVDKEDWTSCSSASDIARETRHLRGDCCNGKHIPIPLAYLRRPALDYIQDCTLEAAVIGGTVLKSNEYNPNGAPIFYTFQRRLSHGESDVRMICQQMCAIKEEFELPEKLTHQKFNITLAWIPPLAGLWSAPVQLRIGKFVIEDKIHVDIKEFAADHMERIIASEFEFNTDRPTLRKTLRMCEALNIFARGVETALMELCGQR